MLLTLDELSKYLKVHHNTVYNWIKEGMPRFRRGSVIRFNLDKVLEWLEENKEKKE